ncbi:rhomboid family intramembrane serine protease, partial [Arthrobacter deserti]|nr:rhomboid family intramembrane serine protease [Arthrobacter deserti]
MSFGAPAEPPHTETPVCPRHPDPVSYVRCQRCGRPACPECQRSAAVGVQCVDCVNELARSVRTPRTVFGAAASGQPVVTVGIIIACVVMYILQWVVPAVAGYLVYAPVYTSQLP